MGLGELLRSETVVVLLVAVSAVVGVGVGFALTDGDVGSTTDTGTDGSQSEVASAEDDHATSDADVESAGTQEGRSDETEKNAAETPADRSDAGDDGNAGEPTTGDGDGSTTDDPDADDAGGSQPADSEPAFDFVDDYDSFFGDDEGVELPVERPRDCRLLCQMILTSVRPSAVGPAAGENDSFVTVNITFVSNDGTTASTELRIDEINVSFDKSSPALDRFVRDDAASTVADETTASSDAADVSPTAGQDGQEGGVLAITTTYHSGTGATASTVAQLREIDAEVERDGRTPFDGGEPEFVTSNLTYVSDDEKTFSTEIRIDQLNVSFDTDNSILDLLLPDDETVVGSDGERTSASQSGSPAAGPTSQAGEQLTINTTEHFEDGSRKSIILRVGEIDVEFERQGRPFLGDILQGERATAGADGTTVVSR